MSKHPKIIEIDMRLWMTQADKARQLGVKPQAISNQIARGKLASWHIGQLNLTLVER